MKKLFNIGRRKSTPKVMHNMDKTSESLLHVLRGFMVLENDTEFMLSIKKDKLEYVKEKHRITFDIVEVNTSVHDVLGFQLRKPGDEVEYIGNIRINDDGTYTFYFLKDDAKSIYPDWINLDLNLKLVSILR